MKALAAAALAAMMVAASIPSLAGAPQPSSSKPSSYAPLPHSNRRVYGAPIQPPIMGHRKSAHHKQTQQHKKKAPANTIRERSKQPRTK